MATTKLVKCHGKAGAPDDARYPPGGGQPPFSKGETRVYDDSYAQAYGYDSGAALAEFTVLFNNQTRPDDQPLYSLEDVKDEAAGKVKTQAASKDKKEAK